MVAGRQQERCGNEQKMEVQDNAMQPRPGEQETRSTHGLGKDDRCPITVVVQFDLAYDQLKRQWQEPGGIPEQEGLALKESARQAVQEFSTFVEEFKAKVEIGCCPPRLVKRN
jgi:hypothetical protein